MLSSFRPSSGQLPSCLPSFSNPFGIPSTEPQTTAFASECVSLFRCSLRICPWLALALSLRSFSLGNCCSRRFAFSAGFLQGPDERTYPWPCSLTLSRYCRCSDWPAPDHSYLWPCCLHLSAAFHQPSVVVEVGSLAATAFVSSAGGPARVAFGPPLGAGPGLHRYPPSLRSCFMRFVRAQWSAQSTNHRRCCCPDRLLELAWCCSRCPDFAAFASSFGASAEERLGTDSGSLHPLALGTLRQWWLVARFHHPHHLARGLGFSLGLSFRPCLARSSPRHLIAHRHSGWVESGFADRLGRLELDKGSVLGPWERTTCRHRPKLYLLAVHLACCIGLVGPRVVLGGCNSHFKPFNASSFSALVLDLAETSSFRPSFKLTEASFSER